MNTINILILIPYHLRPSLNDSILFLLNEYDKRNARLIGFAFTYHFVLMLKNTTLIMLTVKLFDQLCNSADRSTVFHVLVQIGQNTN